MAWTHRFGHDECEFDLFRNTTVRYGYGSFPAIKVGQEFLVISDALFQEAMNLISKSGFCEDLTVHFQLGTMAASEGSIRIPNLDTTISAIGKTAETKVRAIKIRRLLNTLDFNDGSFNCMNRLLQMGSAPKEQQLSLKRFGSIGLHGGM